VTEEGDQLELLVWPDGDINREPERWVRTGACRRCGACCERTERPHYLMGLLDEDVPEGGPDEAATGAEEEREPADESVGPVAGPTEQAPVGPVSAERWNGRWTFWQATPPMPGACPMWRGEGVCAVYGQDDFPHVCRKWPMFPGEMDDYPTCGYRFRRVR
jgi:Fe-S-cluster containining protein